jgi:ferritin-like metal-binding protein YciE
MATSERGKHAPDNLDDCFTRLHEARKVCAYEAIERLVQAGEEVGLSVETLIQMLDGGVNLEELLDLIEARMAARMAAA